MHGTIPTMPECFKFRFESYHHWGYGTWDEKRELTKPDILDSFHCTKCKWDGPIEALESVQVGLELNDLIVQRGCPYMLDRFNLVCPHCKEPIITERRLSNRPNFF
jgi:hypothetical protein